MQCADIDECEDDNGDCPAACANTPGAHECYAPQTCAEVAAKTPGFAGGVDVELFVGGDPAKRWTAYCQAVGGQYREFLTVNPQENDSQYTAGGQAIGQNVVTRFSKIRVDPVELKVFIGDKSFANSNGATLQHPQSPGPDDTVSSMPYAVAMNCRFTNGQGGQPNPGIAHVDLTGTRFSVNRAFTTGGSGDALGNTSGNDQSFTVLGQGSCGWNAPSGTTTYNPFNDRVPADSSNWLQLRYSP